MSGTPAAGSMFRQAHILLLTPFLLVMQSQDCFQSAQALTKSGLMRKWSVQGFSHHRDIVTGLAFRDGTHELYSGSFDRTVKIWSLDDRAYVDTLYGHQSEVRCVDAHNGSLGACPDDNASMLLSLMQPVIGQRRFPVQW